jgi:predicted kinase
MKYVKLFEDFVKGYGEKISKEDFNKHVVAGKKVLYDGFEYDVISNDGVIVKLKAVESGKTKSINYNMFIRQGAIDVVESKLISEGINDPGILKAFFMAGGPGSGKSFVANELFGFPKNAMSSVSYATGLKLVNSDPAFEKMMKDAGLEPGKLAQYAKDKNLWHKIVMPIRTKAKNLSRRMQRNYIAGRLGQVIDGTGKDYDKIRGHRQLYKDMGYDTYMVFVNTSKEVALERNRMRERKLGDDMVALMWEEVQQNLGKFQKLFGSDKMIIVDNSEYGNDQLLDQVEKEINKRLNAPVQNPIGKMWIREMSYGSLSVRFKK